MRLHLNQCIAAMAAGFAAISSPAAIHYVDANGTNPVSPYTNWVTAATNIQNAVDAASSGEQILVTNGVYAAGGRNWFGSGTNRVTLTNSVTLQSVNGPSATMIVGYLAAGLTLTTATRCVYMDSHSVLSGFTLTNGEAGGGNYPAGGGLVGGTATNCVLINNLATNNLGGGAYRSTLINCKLIGNSAGKGGGASACTLVNCLVVSNTATSLGGGVYGENTTGASSLTNCTIVGNSALSTGGGVNNGGIGAMQNCLVYYNTAPSGSNYANIKLNVCCTTPALPGDIGSITNAPLFVNLAGGDFHLLPWSPCINAGNNGYAANAADLDGNPRVIAGTVDIGAYEFQSPVRFVNISNTSPVSPFTNWVTAATNIQDAVDASAAGDFIIVSNGTYKTGGRVMYGSETNRVVLTNAVTLMSVNGPTNTLIVGGTQMRCVYVGSNSLLSGFTLTNGQTASSGDPTNEQSGGGAWCETGGVISNCIVTRNIMAGFHSGLGGGIYGGTIWNSTISGNSAYFGGGVAWATVFNCLIISNNTYTSGLAGGGGAYSCTLGNCTIAGNGGDGSGGGAYNSALNNCVISNNVSWYFGGGTYNSTLTNCKLIGNSASGWGGGADFGTLNNCLIISNSASVGGGANSSTLYNCVVANNKATTHGDGVSGYTGDSTVRNCILYYNNAPAGSNYEANVSLNNCCTTPLPSNGFGNFTSDPMLVNQAGGDFHLQSTSPCINSGNNSYATSATDLDGNTRIVAGTVDVGAYEYPSPASVISYAWLQQYGLAINAGTDTSDADGDGMSNYAEWRAGTNPTNALSLLQMTSVVPTNNTSGVTIIWQSVSGINYLVQRGSNLRAQPVFTTVATGIAGQVGTTSYTDTTATNNVPYFYRVGVQ
jgi:hypothetical protein